MTRTAVVILALFAFPCLQASALGQDERAERVQFQLNAQFPYVESNLPEDLLETLDELQRFGQLSNLNINATRDRRTPGHRDINQTQISAQFEFESFQEYVGWARRADVMALIERLGETASVFRTTMSLRRDSDPQAVRVPRQPRVIPDGR